MVQGRAMNVVEFYMMLFQYPTICTDITFKYIPTQPMNERAATERVQRPIDKLKQNYDYLQGRALTALDIVPCHFARVENNLPSWRQFTDSQIIKIQDDLESTLKTDQVTIFGFRPPELRFVMHQTEYARWFVR